MLITNFFLYNKRRKDNMAVLIGHAVMDENGGIDGAIAGDQTGKEIATR